PGSQTVYSLSTLFSGIYFSQQYWTRVEEGGLWPHEDDSHRFVESLRDAGVATFTFAGALWMVNKYGIVRGFSEETFVQSASRYTPAQLLMDGALNRLSQVGDTP